jgi:prevent-host-death family protein
MSISITEDIRSITELKRQTHQILEQIEKTGRPVVVTVNGKAEAVLMDAVMYEKHIKALNMAKHLLAAEEDVQSKRTRSFDSFLKDFKRAKKL